MLFCLVHRVLVRVRRPNGLFRVAGLFNCQLAICFARRFAAGTDLGLRAKGIMDRGELVSDDIIVGMIAARIDDDDCANGVILDGFPRTVAQAHALDEMLDSKGLALDCVIEIKVDEAALFARIENRAAETGGARSDDNADTLRKRLAVYHENTAPLLPYYADKGVLKTVDGMNSIDEVAAQIDRILG